MMVKHQMTSTSFEIAGYKIDQTFGLVRGLTVRSRSVVGNFGAAIQMLFGGNISLYSSMCEQAREDAFNLMLEHASQHGANAVIGIRYDATEIMGGVSEVLCYGTAVKVSENK